jgi:hypothetical protein
LINTSHGPRTSLPQRAFHPTDHVYQNIHPPDNPPPFAWKSGEGEARRRVGRRRGRLPSSARQSLRVLVPYREEPFDIDLLAFVDVETRFVLSLGNVGCSICPAQTRCGGFGLCLLNDFSGCLIFVVCIQWLSEVNALGIELEFVEVRARRMTSFLLLL